MPSTAPTQLINLITCRQVHSDGLLGGRRGYHCHGECEDHCLGSLQSLQSPFAQLEHYVICVPRNLEVTVLHRNARKAFDTNVSCRLAMQG